MRALVLGGLFLFASAFGAAANVHVLIDKSTQKMTVSVDGAVRHVWPVSTGRAGFGTPNGNFRPQWMARRWFSRKYYNAPMPHSIFFYKGYAIHGTTELRRLGGPASHGCVRLSPRHAATLYALVSERGMSSTRITVTGAAPATRTVRRRPPPRYKAPEPEVYTPRYPAPFYAPRYRYPSYEDDYYGGRYW